MEAILSSPSPVKAGAFFKLRPKEIAALTEALIAAFDASERPGGRRDVWERRELGSVGG